MSERITRPLALFVVSVLLVALAAGAALAQNNASESRAASKSDTKACLVGTIFADFIDDAGKNQNCLSGLAGNDILAGFTFNDFVHGGDGDDKLFGEQDNDVIDGWNGNDKINPGTGDDHALGFSGNDVIDGALTHTPPPGVTLGNGWQTDDQGNDLLEGEAGNDTIIDWVGSDDAYGGTGNDTINVKDGSGGDFVDAGEHFFDFDKVFADSGDTVVNAESVVKSAAGTKSATDQERLSPPKVSSAR